MFAHPCRAPAGIYHSGLLYLLPRWLLLLLLVVSQCRQVHGEVFTLGYLTGSQRRPGNLDYQRPGITISGAISLAVEQVNAGPLSDRGHSLQFVVAETFGEEVASIRQTAALWTQQVAAYIGPQETCVHEGRMAAAFNLPMISYVSSWSLQQYDTVTYNPICSTAPTGIPQTRQISQLLQGRDRRTRRYLNRWWPCCWPLTGLK